MGTIILEFIFLVALIKFGIYLYDEIQTRKENKNPSKKDSEKRNKWEDRFND